MTNHGVTFYFVRHGETFFNYYGRMQGWSNALLTPQGVHDVRRSARGLANTHFDAVYTSDLQRTIDTAQLILEENHTADQLQIVTMPEFREVSFGSFEGLDAKKTWQNVHNELRIKHDLPEGSEVEIHQLLDSIKEMDPYHHAENYLEFWLRVESGILTLLNRHAGTDQNILVVCHGLTIRNILHGLIPDFNETTPLQNASVSITRYENGQFQLMAYNQVDHFQELEEQLED